MFRSAQVDRFKKQILIFRAAAQHSLPLDIIRLSCRDTRRSAALSLGGMWGGGLCVDAITFETDLCTPRRGKKTPYDVCTAAHILRISVVQ
jgi:hypothetical protein